MSDRVKGYWLKPPVDLICAHAWGLVLTNAAAQGILDKARPTLDRGTTAERPLGVLALKILGTVMGTTPTFINI